MNYSQATTNEREMVKISVGSPIKVSSVSSLSEMSTVQGFVGEKPVEVLRDTGCSGVILSKDRKTRKCIHRKKSDHGHGRLFFKGGS